LFLLLGTTPLPFSGTPETTHHPPCIKKGKVVGVAGCVFWEHTAHLPHLMKAFSNTMPKKSRKMTEDERRWQIAGDS